jgi:serine/threonine-protein kinase
LHDSDLTSENAAVVAPVKAGDILADKYCVQRVLGMGGMGVVVAAEHIALHQKVALKFMLPEALADEATVERFMREARAAVRLQSEHVARVMDVGCLDNGAPYIVMEFLEGEDLSDVIHRDGRMEASVAVDFILQACMAMAEAHSIGIVHRDLKPANLFVTKRPDGRSMVKVLDFGISKVQDGASEVHKTKSSMAMGSPGYMAPEQMRSAKHADHRADIWALGVILYQLLADRRPFEAESAPVMFAMVLAGNYQPITEILDDLDPALVEVVHRCLEREREDRYATVAEFAQALVPFGDERAAGMAASIANLGVAAPMADLPSDADARATMPIRKGTPASEPESEALPETHVSDSLPPKLSPAHNAPTTRRASAGQVVVAAPEPDEPAPRKAPVGAMIAGAAGIALVALVASQLFGGDGESRNSDPTTPAATLPAAEPVLPVAVVIDAGLPDAAVQAMVAPDAAPPVVKKAPKRPRRPAKDPKPKPPPPKPKPDDDPFGTMQ